MPQDNFSDIYNKALDILSRREHSKKEVFQKLKSKFSELDLINDVISKLLDNNLIDDKRFAEHYVAARKRKGFGSKKIGYELMTKGIDESISTLVINESGDWDSLASNVFHKKFKSGISDDFKIKAKQKNFLINRGFSFEEIESVFN